MVGVKLSLLLLAAALVAVSAQDTERHGGRPTSYSHNYNYKPKPQTNKPYGYGHGQGNNHGYGHYPSYSNLQQPQVSPPGPCSPNDNLDPTFLHVSPPGPYVDPSQPQISPPAPYYLDPTLPQISPPGPYIDPDMTSPYEPDNFIERSRSDFEDIITRGKRNIDHAESQIKRESEDAKEFVSSDYDEAARLLRIHNNELQRAINSGKDEDQLNECIQNADATIQEQAKANAERSNRCIQNADARASATLNQARENLQIDSDERYDRFNQDEVKLSQCSVHIDRACQKSQVQLLNRNLSNLAADTDNQVKTAQSAATQHSFALSTCRNSQDRSHHELRALARDLVDNCISSTPEKASSAEGTAE